MKDRSFLATARAQLDADHFGLEKIKKRLIEYLAVVRLKELTAEREAALSSAASANAIEGKDGKNGNSGAAQGEGESKAVVPYNKAQQGQKQQQSRPQVGPTKPGRLGKKGVKGPILLCVVFPCFSSSRH